MNDTDKNVKKLHDAINFNIKRNSIPINFPFRRISEASITEGQSTSGRTLNTHDLDELSEEILTPLDHLEILLKDIFVNMEEKF